MTTSSPSTKADLLTALHNAMETNVKVNQSNLSGKAPQSTPDAVESSPTKKQPPAAPPSVAAEPYAPRGRIGRSQSVSVRSSAGYSHVPGQINGQVVPFDPQAEFQKVSSEASASLPRSSLQLEESSTILHPSKFNQIVPFETKFASGMDSRGRPRRHTISGANMSIRVPSAYREVLVKKALAAEKTRTDASASSNSQPLPQSSEAAPSADPSVAVPSALNTVIAADAAPRPSLPHHRRPAPADTADDDDFSESSEEANENEEGKTAEASAPIAQPAETMQVFGLQYSGGLIDFVDHPPTEIEPSHQNDTAPTQPPTNTQPKSEETLEMERAMSPVPSS